ncbi:MAG: hypothetical protein MUE30_19700 [Spirosomaceae bacterium]|jgi:hypothetical protein|nr:hypothetical protein [Spirosomataceae bacterium]
MATVDLKEELHQKIDTISNTAELLDLKYSIDWFLQDKLTWEERHVLDRLAQLPDLLENQMGTLHEEVIAEAKKQWLKK